MGPERVTTERSYKLENEPKALTYDRCSELVQRDWRDLLDAADDQDEAYSRNSLKRVPAWFLADGACRVHPGTERGSPAR
jgi:hypothetical protein